MIPKGKRPSRANAGFVLIEVLVAVGVAAALMAVLIRSFSQTWSGISYVREEAEGSLLARSMMADIQRDRLAPGTQEGVAGRYAWKLTTEVVPVPVMAGKSQKKQQQTQQPASPDGQQQPASSNEQPQQSDNALYHVVLVLVGPSGRSNRLDNFEIGPAAQ
jgi:hypothetical protein